MRVEQAEYVSARSRSPVVARLANGGALLAVCAAASIVVAAAVGSYAIPPSHTARILLEPFGLRTLAASDTERAIESIGLSRLTLALRSEVSGGGVAVVEHDASTGVTQVRRLGPTAAASAP